MKSITFIPLALIVALPSVAEERTKELSDFTLPAPTLNHVPLLTTPAPGNQIPAHVFPNPFFPADVLPRPTAHDKFQRYLNDTYGPGRQINTIVFSAFDQAIDGSDDWGTGAGAYKNRITSQMAKYAVKNTIRFGFDAALRTDSRYRRSDSEAFLPRLGHALLSTVTTYKDGGGRTIGIPQIAGAYGSAFAANLWYPNSRNSTGDALMRGTTSLGFSAGKNVLKEFWPDIKKLFSGR